MSYLLTESHKYPLLTPAQELELGRRVREDEDDEARRLLCLHNIRLVVEIAKRYRGRGVPFVDLVQEGMIGLNRAAEKFDDRKGYRFTTYAWHWVRQACQRCVANHRSTIRTPIHVHDRQSKLYGYLLGHPDATVTEVAAELGMDVEQVENALGAATVVASLDQQLSYDPSSSFVDTLEDPNAPDPADGRVVDMSPLHTALDQLSDDERRVIELRFGFVGDHVHSMKEISVALGLGEHRVQVLQRQALARLRELLADEELELV